MVKIVTTPKAGGPSRKAVQGRAGRAISKLPLPSPVDERLFIEKGPATFTSLPRFSNPVFVGSSSMSPAVNAVTLAGLGATALVGLPMTAHAQELPPSTELTRAQLEDAIARLELRRSEMSPEELDAERARLWQLYVRAGGLTNTEPTRRTDSTTNTETTPTRTRGELRMERLARDIEFEMRITARDVAMRDFTPIDGLPGYKELTGERVRELIVSALKDIPLGELPGGHLLVNLVRQLPNTDSLDVANLTYRELQHSLGDAQRGWLESRFRPVFEEHKIEAAVVAFGSVTAIRYTSPEAARTLDRVLPRLGIYDRELWNNTRVEADLRYRNAEILPNVDISVRSRYPINDNTTARLDAEGTLSVEADRPVTGRVTGGVRYVENSTWVDGSVYVTDTGRYGAGVEAGTSHAPSGLNARAYVHSHFGEGTATGDASGRVMYGVDLTRDVNINGARGNFGLYVGGGVDTDGSRSDVNAGVVFTLRW